MVFGYCVVDFECYGVVVFDVEGQVSLIIEKLLVLLLDYVVMGLYFFDGMVFQWVCSVQFLDWGEFEIIMLLEIYLYDGSLLVECMGCGFVWLDIGIYVSLLDVGNFVCMFEQWQGLQIGCFDEIVFD